MLMATNANANVARMRILRISSLFCLRCHRHLMRGVPLFCRPRALCLQQKVHVGACDRFAFTLPMLPIPLVTLHRQRLLFNVLSMPKQPYLRKTLPSSSHLDCLLALTTLADTCFRLNTEILWQAKEINLSTIQHNKNTFIYGNLHYPSKHIYA